jgi:glycerol-3-phosphate dehydrogenase
VDVAIVGGGIHGCALARELTLRNISCAVVDKGAIGGGTSQWSSQLLHGGIRYMLTGDLQQMHEGLTERATWARIAPWRVRWEAFWMPHDSWLEGLSHRFGIGLYDYWGADRPGWPDSLHLGAVASAEFEADPRSHEGPFVGATAYADLLTWDRDLVMDLLASSAASDFSGHEVEAFRDEDGKLTSARLRDRLDGTARTLRAKQWVFALGSWHDQATQAWFGEKHRRLRLSSGIHLWFPPIPGCDRPWAIRRPGGRILFVIPRDGLLQVGTTEREVETREGGAVTIQASEREELYGALEEYLPGLPWRTLPVIAEEVGVRPLVRPPEDQRGTSNLSREALLEKHPAFENLTSVLGGKLTTARTLMAKLATDLTHDPCPASASARLTRWDGQPS